MRLNSARFQVAVKFKMFLILALLCNLQPMSAATVEDRLKEYGNVAKERLLPHFQKLNVPFPPQSITLIAFKYEKVVELYLPNRKGEVTLVKSYPILAASGKLGPKLREGDYQVPEGLYQITALNPNSSYHLSLRVGYPSKEDIAQASVDKRSSLGGDIMFHGKKMGLWALSIGCIALDDASIEEVFTLAALTGIQNIKVIISPYDFRKGEQPQLTADQPAWVQQRYQKIREALRMYPTQSPSKP